MRTKKNTWQSILYIIILLAAVCLLFQWYANANSRRIETQNLNYAWDSARQTTTRIESEFNNALLRLRNYAYLIGNNEGELNITSDLLKGMEEHASFDAIRFTNAEGVNLASDGRTSDSRDRHYFTGGITGESGMDVIRSRLNGQMITTFYAPVEHNGEIVGVLLGIYQAEDYLQNMLATSYFGEEAGTYLCAQNGDVIAASDGSGYEQPLLDAFHEEGVIDSASAAKAWQVFRGDTEEYGLICSGSSKTDNLCVINIPNRDYVLVQTFPKDVTQAMLRSANHTGMVLQAVLAGLFAVYLLILLLRARRKRLQLVRESQEHISGLQENALRDRMEIARANLAMEGMGHSVVIHSNTAEHIEAVPGVVNVSRYAVNQVGGTALGGAMDNGLNPTTTLGCGTWGNNIISENLWYTHLMNVSRISYKVPGMYVPSDEEIWA